ncbi:MAG: hypothetical protein EXR77_12475 [Myxococcales bacterium]|nr:hypothetical protein [Myxococcales bacterium]
MDMSNCTVVSVQPVSSKRSILRPTLAQRVAARDSIRTSLGVELELQLPVSTADECYVLTTQGQRIAFANARALLNHVRKHRDVTAVCLDCCAWRTFASFWYQIRLGCSAAEAFERADFAGLGGRRVSK